MYIELVRHALGVFVNINWEFENAVILPKLTTIGFFFKDQTSKNGIKDPSLILYILLRVDDSLTLIR
jgi:hypothetical protein